jgi:hypothetical protein
MLYYRLFFFFSSSILSSRARRSSNKAVVGIPLGLAHNIYILSYSFSLFKLLFRPFIFTRAVCVCVFVGIPMSEKKILFIAGILNAPELSGLKPPLKKIIIFLSVCKVGHTSSVDRFKIKKRKKVDRTIYDIKCPERRTFYPQSRAVVSSCCPYRRQMTLDGES